MSSKNNKHRLKISPQNSRINFGSLIFEAAKQGDWEGLDLILSQDGGKLAYLNTTYVIVKRHDIIVIVLLFSSIQSLLIMSTIKIALAV